MIKQLSPALPIITPKGKGLANFLIDYGLEHNLQWVVFLDDNGELGGFYRIFFCDFLSIYSAGRTFYRNS